MPENDQAQEQELAVLAARERVLELEIRLQEQREAAANAEARARTATDGAGGAEAERLDYVIPAKYPGARHALSLPDKGIERLGKPALLDLFTNPVAQHLEAEAVKAGHRTSHNAWIFRSIVSIGAYLELGCLHIDAEVFEELEALARALTDLEPERDPQGALVDSEKQELAEQLERASAVLTKLDDAVDRGLNTLQGTLELAAELEDFFVANKGPTSVVSRATADATVEQLIEETTRYAPRSSRVARIQKDVRASRATAIAKAAAQKGIGKDPAATKRGGDKEKK